MTTLAKSGEGGVIQALRPEANQVVAYTGTAGTSTAVPDKKVTVARVVVTSNAHIKISQAGTAAVAGDLYLPLGVVEYFRVNNGDKISAIQDTAGGNLSVTWMR